MCIACVPRTEAFLSRSNVAARTCRNPFHTLPLSLLRERGTPRESYDSTGLVTMPTRFLLTSW